MNTYEIGGISLTGLVGIFIIVAVVLLCIAACVALCLPNKNANSDQP